MAAVGTSDILEKILARKVEEVAERSRTVSLASLREQAKAQPAPRGFVARLKAENAAGRSGVIAEVKKASPSKGLIRPDFDPAWIARSYEAGGAACLSVLTDVDFFQGSDDFLRQAREACSLPVLRKDFVIDPYQIYEARVLGADCVLLIVAGLDDAQLDELYHVAGEVGLDVLVEVHNEAELERAAALRPALLGINNRDLRSFHTDLQVSVRLRDLAPADSLLVTESGIFTREDVALMRDVGIDCFLVGESFMRAPEPGEKLREIFF